MIRYASKRRVRRHACERKKPHATKHDAETAASWMRANFFADQLNVYQCQFCGHWHVGHLKIDGSDPSGIRKRYR